MLSVIRCTYLMIYQLRALNDIYLFKDNIDASLTRYFGLDVHQSILSSWDLKPFLPEPSIKAASWCIDSPNDFMSCVSRCSDCMTDWIDSCIEQMAMISRNMIQSHTNLIFVFMLPKRSTSNALFSLPNSNLPRTILQLNPMKWNWVDKWEQLTMLWWRTGSHILIFCGILAQGKIMFNYVKDMVFPQVYRFRRISKVNLCFSLSQIDSLPTITLPLIQLEVNTNTVIELYIS